MQNPSKANCELGNELGDTRELAAAAAGGLAALPAGLACFFGGPLVGGAFGMGGPTTLGCDLALLFL